MCCSRLRCDLALTVVVPGCYLAKAVTLAGRLIPVTFVDFVRCRSLDCCWLLLHVYDCCILGPHIYGDLVQLTSHIPRTLRSTPCDCYDVVTRLLDDPTLDALLTLIYVAFALRVTIPRCRLLPCNLHSHATFDLIACGRLVRFVVRLFVDLLLVGRPRCGTAAPRYAFVIPVISVDVVHLLPRPTELVFALVTCRLRWLIIPSPVGYPCGYYVVRAPFPFLFPLPSHNLADSSRCWVLIDSPDDSLPIHSPLLIICSCTLICCWWW